MKRIVTKLMMVVVFTFSFILSAYADETYTLDPTHTYVQWHINHFGFSNPSGKWMAEGTLVLDEKKPQNSKVTVDIHLADLVTGIPKLDEHLKSKDFFDVGQYPVATFTSNKVDVKSKRTALVQGTLTIHGISKPITLHVTMNKAGVSPVSHKQTVGFTATAKLNRSDFGISSYLPGLGDEVKLDIEAEGVKS